MNLEDNEEDCTIYIEELKSDDPNIKVNAVSKIASIAEILGPKRAREELIPYLIEIIEELDNEDEFLIKLSEQIYKLNEFIDGKEYSYILISPLELICSMEETSVREKAVECLIQVSQDQSQKFFSNYYLQTVKQLAQWDNFSSRISACSLLGACYPQISSFEKEELLSFFEELCKDDTPMVRRTAAQNLGNIADVSTPEFIETALAPLWLQLMKDTTDSVKVKAIEVSTKLILKLEKQQVSDIFIKPLKEVINQKNKSWRMRYAVAEILGDLISHLEKEISKKEILTIYESLLKDTEHEVRSAALLKLKEICTILPESMIMSNILPILSGFVSDASQYVRTTLGENLCEISSQLEVKNIITGILPIIENILKDESLEVRLNLMNHIQLLMANISSDNVKKHLLPLFNQITNDKQWRFRLVFVQFLPKLTKQMGYSEFKEQFVDFMNQFLYDHYAAIREQNFKNFITLSNQHGYSTFKQTILDGLRNLTHSTNYIYRVSALQGFLAIIEIFPKEDLQAIFQELCNKLLNDSVPNVKIQLLKLYIAIRDKLDLQIKNAFAQKAKYLLSNDADSDVSYYLNEILL